MEIKAPGATGRFPTPAAVFTIPPGAMIGDACSGLDTRPLTCAVPRTLLPGFDAVTVTVTRSPAARPSHEPVHRPSRSETRGKGGSPLEKLATTEPSRKGSPQSST